MIDYEQLLLEKYDNKTTLSAEELAEELNTTPRTINRLSLACSDEVPACKKVGGKRVFPIKAVAIFLDNTIKVA